MCMRVYERASVRQRKTMATRAWASIHRIQCSFSSLQCSISFSLHIRSTEFPAVSLLFSATIVDRVNNERFKFHEEVKFICIFCKIVFVMEILSHFPCLILYALPLSVFAFSKSFWTLPLSISPSLNSIQKLTKVRAAALQRSIEKPAMQMHQAHQMRSPKTARHQFHHLQTTNVYWPFFFIIQNLKHNSAVVLRGVMQFYVQF